MMIADETTVPKFVSPDQIYDELNRSLNPIEDFQDCALFDYPDFFNIGDHLIWLGLLMWITRKRLSRISYISSHNTFSSKEFEKNPPEARSSLRVAAI